MKDVQVSMAHYVNQGRMEAPPFVLEIAYMYVLIIFI